MSTEVTKPPSFEEVIINKLRKDIGDLMPDEVLKDVISKATHHIFFDPVKTPRSYGGYDTEAYSWLEKTCRDLLEKRMNAALQVYMAQNPDVVKKAVDDALAGGIVAAIGRALDWKIQSATQPLTDQLYKALSQ